MEIDFDRKNCRYFINFILYLIYRRMGDMDEQKIENFLISSNQLLRKGKGFPFPLITNGYCR